VSIYTGVVLEDDVFCGPSMVFTNVINPRSHVERKSEFLETRVRQGASIGANATIICGVTLGKYCFVGAGAVVTKDIPDYGMVLGNPARLRGYVCYCGHKLEFAPAQRVVDCSSCGRRYEKRDSGVQESS
jgi:UDP-2-acetamido-3-amino-2,3-dideoxy-glucuronate N-acetyltransferase